MTHRHSLGDSKRLDSDSDMHRRLAETIKSFEHGIKDSRRPEDRQIARDYLAALAPVLASTVLGDDILSEIRAIDRLFGQTWITDADATSQVN